MGCPNDGSLKIRLGSIITNCMLLSYLLVLVIGLLVFWANVEVPIELTQKHNIEKFI
jgi:hypothetical protein